MGDLLSTEDLEAELDFAARQYPGAASAIRRHIAALEKERDAALADNAALLQRAFAMCPGCHGRQTLPILDTECNEIGRQPCAACEDIRVPHPGAALLEEMDTLRQRQALWEEAALALYGYTEFIGPCAHGRDPWDRCDECGETNALRAAVGLLNKELEEHRKALVRARNEGLEKAAAWAEAMTAQGLAPSSIQASIRAMKELES